MLGRLGKTGARRRKPRTETERRGERSAPEKLLRRMLADGTPALSAAFDYAVAYLEGPATWYVAEKVAAAKRRLFSILITAEPDTRRRWMGML